MSAQKTVTACLIIIGNEILSGRTQDANLAYLGQELNEIGVQMREARVVPDIEEEIVNTINECRAKFDYVFTTGGIGPTHDDITADCVGKAFGLAVTHHPEALARMREHYERTGRELNEARMRMARTPEGATLIENAISTAPGFQVENVYVMAGVPMVMRSMFDTLKQRLTGGAPVRSRSLSTYLGEGILAAGLAAIQERFADVDIGSYPFYRETNYGVSVVLRSTDTARIDEASAEVMGLIAELGGELIEDSAA